MLHKKNRKLVLSKDGKPLIEIHSKTESHSQAREHTCKEYHERTHNPDRSPEKQKGRQRARDRMMKQRSATSPEVPNHDNEQAQTSDLQSTRSLDEENSEFSESDVDGSYINEDFGGIDEDEE